MFTPDGRLLQVEYASLAASHSSPLVIVRVDGDDDNDVHDVHDGGGGKDSGASILMVSLSSKRSQKRVVSVGGDVLVAMSGVLSDSLALLRQVYQERDKFMHSYGNTYSNNKAATTKLVVNTLSNACQLHAFAGGLRPYGSTMVVCEIDGSNNSKVHRVDPSGAINTLPDNAVVTVVGGSKDVQDILHRTCKTNSNRKSLGETLKTVTKALLEEHAREKRKTKKEEGEDRNEAHNLWMEVAVLSSRHGIYHLDDSQIEEIRGGSEPLRAKGIFQTKRKRQILGVHPGVPGLTDNKSRAGATGK